MSPAILLATDARARGITAMSVLAMARETSTRPIAEAIDMPTGDGSTVRGVEAAKRILVDELAENATAWSEWLTDSAHANAAAAMTVALDDQLLSQLAERNDVEQLLVVINDHRERRANTRVISGELARRNEQDKVIDLTEQRSHTSA